MQIRGIAQWHGSGIKLAQERLVVGIYGLREVFEGFRLAVRYFFILLTAQSSRNTETEGFTPFYKVSGYP